MRDIFRHFDDGLTFSLGYGLHSRRQRCKKESISRATLRRTCNSRRRSRHCHQCLSTIRAQRATCRPSPVTHRPSPIARRPSSVARCPLSVAYRSLPIIRCPLPVAAEKQCSFPLWHTAAVCATMEVQRLCKGRTINRTRTEISQDSVAFCLSSSLSLDSSIIRWMAKGDNVRVKETHSCSKCTVLKNIFYLSCSGRKTVPR